MDLTEGRATANGLEFGLLEAGPLDGPLALCLHGFPDTAYGWRHLLPALADRGFRAVAPFMRGYAPTAVPGDGDYSTGALAADAIALHDALGGRDDAVIIGHDWGAMATYGAAAHAPDRWRRVVTMAVPPLAAMGNAFFDYDQIKRSFYMFFFQTPLADMAVPMDDFAFIAGLWRDWSPGYDGVGNGDVGRVADALRDPAHLSAAIGYYRSMFGTLPATERFSAEQAACAAPTPQPTLYLHGREDGCLGVDLVHDVEQFLGDGSEVAIIEGAGHFLQLDSADEVTKRVVEWVTSS